VYSLTEAEFFNKLLDNNIDIFCDIRRRRGVRGARYSFVNSLRLQKKLRELNINYFHFLEFSPSKEIREKQKEEDKKLKIMKRERTSLGETFINSFIDDNLIDDNISAFNNTIGENAENVVLFCVELEPKACHRSLVAEALFNQNPEIKVIHL
jgi:uncharacterized protein (DUF488 family)